MCQHDDLGVGTSSSFQSPQVPDTGTADLSTASSEKSELDQLIAMFEDLSPKQITAVYLLSGSNFDCTLQCLLEGPNLYSIIMIMNRYFENKPTVKINIETQSAWEDLLMHYKSTKVDYSLGIRIALGGKMVIDTGGIRRQIYTQVYFEFAHNKHMHLFDGETHLLRPATSAIARSSGILKILGKMLSHSIYQDGIGFPYLSPLCYWYLIGNKNMAIEHVSLADIPSDSASFIKEVMYI